MAGKNLFNSVKMPRVPSNNFDLTHDVKLTTVMGKLTPIMVQEALPGDRFNISAESLIRFMPLVAPVMHRMNVYMHYFFVPNRLLWDEWETFITGANQLPPGTPTPTAPFIQMNSTQTQPGSLPNLLGVPELTAPNVHNVNALPMAAYQMIYQEYYRDQNLIADVNYKLVSGDNSANLDLNMTRTRAWEHDYLTSALPFAQKGAPVSLPIGSFEDVNVYQQTGVAGTTTWTTTGVPTMTQAQVLQGDSTNPAIGNTELFVPLSQVVVGATTINDLRTAVAIQEWLEKNARGGTRYKESIKSHFDVTSPDSRLDRPEYITGSKSPVVISEVLNTTGETGGLEQGNMAGHGVAVTAGKQGSYYCTEHGYIIGIMSIMPLTAYQQGLSKMWTRFNPYDYYWPSFAHLGEQEILNKEVYADDNTTHDDVFGYTPRYAEYKYMQNRIAGDMQTSLAFWHLGRIFSAPQSLNQTFIECDPRTDIFAAAASADYLVCHVLNKVYANRRMPVYGTPTF